MAFLGMLIEALMLLLLLPKRIVIRFLPALGMIAGLLFFRLAPADYWNWMSTIKAPQQEASAASRFVLTETSLKILADYPMGVGYKNYQFVSPNYLDPSLLSNGRRSAHNSFFAILCEAGPFAFFFWLVAFAGALVIMRRVRKSAEPRSPTSIQVYAMGMEVGLYGWLVGGLFHDVHDVDPAYWFVALSIVVYRLNCCSQMAETDYMPVESNLVFKRSTIGMQD